MREVYSITVSILADDPAVAVRVAEDIRDVVNSAETQRKDFTIGKVQLESKTPEPIPRAYRERLPGLHCSMRELVERLEKVAARTVGLGKTHSVKRADLLEVIRHLRKMERGA